MGWEGVWQGALGRSEARHAVQAQVWLVPTSNSVSSAGVFALETVRGQPGGHTGSVFALEEGVLLKRACLSQRRACLRQRL